MSGRPPPLDHLGNLLRERPTTKMGQVRAAWPFIRSALEAGHSLKSIWKRLQADGVDIAYNRLSEYIGRIDAAAYRAPLAARRPAESSKSTGATLLNRLRPLVPTPIRLQTCGNG